MTNHSNRVVQFTDTLIKRDRRWQLAVGPDFTTGKIGAVTPLCSSPNGAGALDFCFLISVSRNKMPDVDLAIRHPALQSMCSKD
jgi:hypothetical protein